MSSTRQSLAMATSILRMVAACWASFESNWRRSSFVTPSTTAGDHRAEFRLDGDEREAGVLDGVVQEGGGDGRRRRGPGRPRSWRRQSGG